MSSAPSACRSRIQKPRVSEVSCSKLSWGLQCSDLNSSDKCPTQWSSVEQGLLQGARPLAQLLPAPAAATITLRSSFRSGWLLEAVVCFVLSVQRRSCPDGRAVRKARLGRSPWFLANMQRDKEAWDQHFRCAQWPGSRSIRTARGT